MMRLPVGWKELCMQFPQGNKISTEGQLYGGVNLPLIKNRTDRFPTRRLLIGARAMASTLLLIEKSSGRRGTRNRI